jgi:hypothetical protein
MVASSPSSCHDRVRQWQLLRYCEARSAVAIHVPAPRPQWIASFLAMTGQGRDDHPFRHCEARSAVAIQVFVQPPMDCFVPRNDEVGAQ